MKPLLQTGVGRRSMPRMVTELLEPRRLLSTVTVTSAADATDYASSVTISQLSSTPVTLRDALNAANNTGGNNTIVFNASLAGSTISIASTGDGTFGPSAFAVSSQVTINGSSAPGLVIARNTTGTGSGLRLFYVTSAGNLTLENLTLSGGLALGGSSGYGGGAAGLGGAIVNAGTLTLLQATLTGNQAIGGTGDNWSNGDGGGGLGGTSSGVNGGGPNGGAYSSGNGGAGGFGGGGGLGGGAGGAGGFGGGGGAGDSTGGNGGFGGGGAYPSGASGFAAGSSSGGGAGLGGAIFNYGGTVTIADSTLATNSAAGGGGGYIGTSGTGLGGAIFNLNGSMLATNSTLAYNSAGSGGAIYSLGDNGVATQSGPALAHTAAIVTLNNTILSGSSGSNDFLQGVNDSSRTGTETGTASSSGANDIIQTEVSSANGFGGTAVNVNPMLAGGAIASYGGPTQTFALLPGSPAIDAGSNSLAVLNGVALGTDQCGSNRIQNTTVDIGSFESAGFTVTATGGNNQVTRIGTAFASALAVTVTSNGATINLAGGDIQFTSPSSGASATFASNPITLNSSGAGTDTATANGTVGSYNISESGAGITTAATFSLSNNDAPVVATNPSSQTIAAFQNVTFTAAASGSPTPTVQWEVSTNGGSTYTTLTSATGTTLTFAVSGTLSGNKYIAVFNNSAGNATTTAATLTVSRLTPTVTATDGGTYTGSAITATELVTGTSGPAAASLETVTPTLLYYAGSTATGSSSSVAPSLAGTYTVVASFAGSTDYTSANSAATTFNITTATPHATVADSGGVFSNSPLGGTSTITGVGSGASAGSSLEGISPTISYYTGSTATGTPLSGAPTSVGTYTALASFAGSADYALANSLPVTFTITTATPHLTLADNGGNYIGTAFSAASTITGVGVGASAGSSLESISPTITYYSGSTATGTPLSGAPTAPGTYTALASFAGSVDYALASSLPATFTITTATPHLTLADNGGVYIGTAFSAASTITGVGSGASASSSLQGIFPTIAYYTGSTATGTPLPGAPTSPGTYTALASFTGSTDYALANSVPATFTVTAATPILTVADNSGVFSNSPFSATSTLTGVESGAIAGSSLEGIAPTISYYSGSSATGTPLSAAPIHPGTYTALASFAGSVDYSPLNLPTTFQITPGSVALNISSLTVAYNGTSHAATNVTLTAEPASATSLGSLLDVSYQSSLTGAVTTTAPVYPGTYAILASFAGNADYGPIAEFNTGQTVTISPFATLAGPTIIQKTPHATFSGKIAAKSQIKGGIVTIQFAGITRKLKIARNGSFAASFSTAKLALGNYNVVYTYYNPGKIAATSWTDTLTVKPKPPKPVVHRPSHTN